MKQFLFVLSVCIFVSSFIYGQDNPDGYITINFDEYDLDTYDDLKSKMANDTNNEGNILINASEFAGEQEKELKELINNRAGDEIVLSFEGKAEKAKSKESYRIKFLTNQIKLYNSMLLKAKEKSFRKKENIGYDVSPYKNNFFDLSLVGGYSNNVYRNFYESPYVQHGGLVGFEFGYSRAVNEYCALGFSFHTGFMAPFFGYNMYIIPEFNLMIGHLPSNIAGIFNIGVGYGFGFQFGIYINGFTFKMGYAIPGIQFSGRFESNILSIAIGYRINWASKIKIK